MSDAEGNSAQTNRIVMVEGLPSVTELHSYVAGTNIPSGSRVVAIQATVNPNGLETLAYIEFGLSAAYSGSSLPTLLPAGFASSNLTASLNGVIPGVTYHWHVYASNALGVADGPDQTFTVPAIFAPGDVNGDGVVDSEEFTAAVASHGIVSQNELNAVLANYWPASPWLDITNTTGLGGEYVTVALTNSTAGAFSVWMTTNLADWESLGPATPRYEFFDTNAPAIPQRFYRLSWP